MVIFHSYVSLPDGKSGIAVQTHENSDHSARANFFFCRQTSPRKLQGWFAGITMITYTDSIQASNGMAWESCCSGPTVFSPFVRTSWQPTPPSPQSCSHPGLSLHLAHPGYPGRTSWNITHHPFVKWRHREPFWTENPTQTNSIEMDGISGLRWCYKS